MPRPQFMMVNGKAVCVTKSKGRTHKKSKQHQKVAAIQRQAQEQKVAARTKKAGSENDK